MEHPEGIESSIEKIKFYIDKNGGFLTITDISEIRNSKDGSINIYDNNKNEIPLFYKKMDGSFGRVINNNFLFSDLTIDHSPSIHTVLFTLYLNKATEYTVLNEFYKSITSEKLNLSEIKAGGFKDMVIEKLDTSIEKNKILNAYKTIFDSIELEIIPKENNNANLSISSLEFYINNSSKQKCINI
ncbi:hypothetical protein [Lacinutrix himadriensis]|uniref:hypothetical protein n=1 Tax=Lacinutrix himadriensis TaxID=641549 RepID=UPI0006E40A63|nr:hypothetical protein [Lacinutrix himadriensis]